MKFIRYVEGDTYLHNLNPISKAIGIFIIVISVVVSKDWLFISLVVTIAFLSILSAGVKFSDIKELIKWLIILVLVIILLNFLFYRPDVDYKNYRRIFVLSEAGLYRGLFIGLRIVAVMFLSSVFVFSTDPSDFVSALMQNLKLSPRIGYSVMVALRTIPLFEMDFERIKVAHKIRLYKPEGSFWSKLRFSIVSVAIPLFVLAIIRAERASVAIAARGLRKETKRTFLRSWDFKFSDWIFLLVSLILSLTGLLAKIR